MKNPGSARGFSFRSIIYHNSQGSCRRNHYRSQAEQQKFFSSALHNLRLRRGSSA